MSFLLTGMAALVFCKVLLHSQLLDNTPAIDGRGACLIGYSSMHRRWTDNRLRDCLDSVAFSIKNEFCMYRSHRSRFASQDLSETLPPIDRLYSAYIAMPA